MPVSYSGIIEEHLAVRNSAGIFDLSHMGEFEISGPHALATARARVHQFRGAAQAMGRRSTRSMCTENGGTIDDLIVYRLGAERYMLCVNASQYRGGPRMARRAQRRARRVRGCERRDRADRGPGADGRRDPGDARGFSDRRVPRFGVASGASRGNHVRGCAHRLHRRRRLRAVRCDNNGARQLFEAILDVGAAAGYQAVSDLARATRCGSRPACRSTVTNSIARRRRSKRDWRRS